MPYLDALNQSTGTPSSPQGSPALTSPAPAPQESPAPAAGGLDPETATPEQMAAIPPIHAILSGAVPGFRVAENDVSVIEPLVRSLPTLAKLGLSAYRSQEKDVVVYSPKAISPEALQKLDKSNGIATAIPPLRELAVAAQNQAAAPAPQGTPAPSAAPQPATMAAPMPGAPLPARAQTRIAGQRIAALSPQAPTSGSVPGQGRILQGLLQRTV